MDNSFIKLYRSLLDWEWWDDQNVTRLFLTILLSVNWQEKQWHGLTITSGQMFTSIDHLAQKSGLSLQQTRTALKKLISTGEITNKSTNNGRLITVENWGKYQHCPEKVTNKTTDNLTIEQQTDNKQVTNDQQQLKKDKNNKNLNNDKNILGQQYIDPITGRKRMRVRA